MQATPPVLRPLLPEHLPAVLAIEQQVTPHPWTRGHFADSLKAGHYARGLWLDEAPDDRPQSDGPDGPSLCGYCIAMPGYQEAHLLNIAVTPAQQGRGWAQHMLADLRQWARSQQAQALWLEVRISNLRAQQLYLRQGFRRTGTRRGYYPCPHGAREDALLMHLPLSPTPAPKTS